MSRRRRIVDHPLYPIFVEARLRYLERAEREKERMDAGRREGGEKRKGKRKARATRTLSCSPW